MFLGHAQAPLTAGGAIELDERDLPRGDSLPDLDEVDGIVAFGGDQSVRDIERLPYLQAEAELMRRAVDRGIPLLGVCLGGQLLAHALGGEVTRMQKRTVAWYEVERLPAADGDPVAGRLPERFRALHWNEDSFTVPDGAVELLSRAGPGGEAFRAGERAWGVQFHPEADTPALDGWYASTAGWLEEGGISEEQARAADREHMPGQSATAGALFGGFAEVVRSYTAARR